MKKKEHEIRIMVSDEEYKQIKTCAEKVNRPVAGYVRTVATNGKVVIKNYDPVREHTREIAEVRNSINRLVFIIMATNQILPQEIKTVLNMMQRIFESENDLLKTIREDGCMQNILDL